MSDTIEQYYQLKARHPGLVLLFHLGASFLAYGEDAEAVAATLGEGLYYRLGRSEGRPVAFPAPLLDKALERLLAAGKAVAICEQVQPDPPTAA